MNRHPLSNLFARFDLTGADLDALAEDIQAHGLRSAITLHEGQILDGWNRYQACQLAGVKPRFEDLAPGVDPWEFVKGSNMLRRHMKPEERATVMLLKFQMEGVPNGTPSVREIQKDLEVGQGTAQRARKVAEAHDPALVDALADKRVSLDRAAELAKMPAAERQAAINAPKVPRLVPKAQPEASAELAAEVLALRQENTELKAQLNEVSEMLQAAQEELDSTRRVLDGEDMLANFDHEVKRNQELARVIQSRNNGLMNENADLIKRLKSALRKIERLEKVPA